MARQNTVDFDTEDDIFLTPAPPEPPDTQKIHVDCDTGPPCLPGDWALMSV